MSRHDYSKYSDKNRDRNVNKNNANHNVAKPEAAANFTAPEFKMEVNAVNPAPVNLVEETVETVALNETVTGTVANCAKLNVRATPSITSDVVCVLDVTSEIEIDVAKSNREWFHVCTAAGMEGYCMRKFVEAHL